jgi:HD-GYP domain-containing protein (c-di-GMP phosphodiesterase class II)
MADPGMDRRSLSGHCEVAARLAARLGVDAAIERALAHAYERWDGRGYPDGLAGEDVPVEVRVVTVARDVELWFRHGGWPAVVEVLGHRRDRGYDPAVVDAFLAEGRKWLEGVSDDLCARVFDIEPRPVATLGSVTVDEALAAMADFADMKSPWFLGRSPAVSVLADAAAGLSGLDDEERIGLRRAALVHDIGRVGVPSGIWDQSRPLTSEQWERVRLHPYLSERVLGRCKVLEPHAPLAGRHHERGDGSGYHRGMTAAGLTPSDDILAAADTYQAMIEPRSYRPARSASEAAGLLIEQVNEGRLSHRAVDAVLGAAGHHSRPANVRRPASLTEREVDVLRLLARGRSNRAIAAELSISPKTVGHHVEHIYTKTGVNTRAGATLFAVETGLVGARTRP